MSQAKQTTFLITLQKKPGGQLHVGEGRATWHKFMRHAEVHEGCRAMLSDPDAFLADVQQADPRSVNLCQRLRKTGGCSGSYNTLTT